MPQITAQNIGQVIRNPTGPVYQTNNFYPEKKANLPANIPPPKNFIGRGAELDHLQKAVKAGKTSFVLYGTGGVGKTDLALKFIDQIKDDYQARIRVDMRGLDVLPLSPLEAMFEIIRGFEEDFQENQNEGAIESLYVSLMNRYKTLILLDNAYGREQVEPLNQSEADLVITSRNTFNVSGGFSLHLKQLSTEDSKELLYSIAGKERFENREGELAQMAGNMPMALLPLAGLLYRDVTLDVGELLEQYKKRGEILDLADPNRKNLSVKSSFELSFRKLDDLTRERWLKLTVFPSDFDLKAMEAVWEGEGDSKATLSKLVEGNLLIYDPETKRSRMHDLAREYTRIKIESEKLEKTRRLHSDYYGKYLFDYRLLNPENLKRFEREKVNIRFGFENLLEGIEKDKEAARLVLKYTAYASELLQLALPAKELVKWMEAGIAASRVINERQSEATHIGNLGQVYLKLGDYRKTIDCSEKALRISEELGDRANVNVWLGSLGNALVSLSRWKEANEYYERALGVSRELGDAKTEGLWLGNLGVSHLYMGNYPESIKHFEQALEISRKIGDRKNEGLWLGNLGHIYLNLGDFDACTDNTQQALDIALELGDLQAQSSWLGNLGSCNFGTGECDKAIEYYEKALKISVEIEDLKNQGNWFGNIGLIYSDSGETEKALEHFNRALEIARKIGDLKNEGIWLGYIGLTRIFEGDVEGGLENLKKALEVSRQIGDRFYEFNWLDRLGAYYFDSGDFESAEGFFRAGLDLAEKLGQKVYEAILSGNLGVSLLGSNKDQEGETYLNRGLEIFRELEDSYNECHFIYQAGKVLAHNGRVAESAEFYREAIGLAEKLEEKSIHLTWVNELGVLYLDGGDYPKALEHFQKALTISRKEKLKEDEPVFLQNLAVTYLRMKEMKKSVDFYKRAMKLYEGSNPDQAEAIRQFLESQMGDQG